MDLNSVSEALKKLNEIKKNDEAAHSLEDDIYYDFVDYVAKGNTKDIHRMANEILKTRDIEFCRWCA